MVKNYNSNSKLYTSVKDFNQAITPPRSHNEDDGQAYVPEPTEFMKLAKTRSSFFQSRCATFFKGDEVPINHEPKPDTPDTMIR